MRTTMTTTPEHGTRRGARALLAACAAPARWVAAPVRAARDAYGIFHPPPSPAASGPVTLTTAGRRGQPHLPEPSELPIRQVSVTTSRDRLVLDAWVVSGEGPHTVVVCHGMGREKSSVVAHIRMLHTAGYHVVAYDLRNHGGSGRDRRWTRMADRFTSDLADVLHYVRHDATLGGGRLAVLAFSFSTWPAVYVLRERSIDVSAVICDSGPLYDIPAGFEHFSQLRRPALPGWLRQGSAFSLYRSAFRRVADRILAVRSWPPDLTGVATPLLFIAGSDDVIVPPTQVQPVAEHYAGATYWVAPNARHMSAVRTDRADYESRVTGFLADAFVRATPGSRLEQAYE